MKFLTIKRKIFIACFCFFMIANAQAEVVVIANKEIPVSSMSRDQIYRIYLGKTKFLPNGMKVIPVDQQPGSSVRNTFYSKVIKKSATQMKAYWSRIIFTGQGNPPIQESGDTAVVELIKKNPNCVGYVDKSAVNDSVKVIYSV